MNAHGNVVHLIQTRIVSRLIAISTVVWEKLHTHQKKTTKKQITRKEALKLKERQYTNCECLVSVVKVKVHRVDLQAVEM